VQKVGYRTGHFGKWHLDGLRGPGAPILASDLRRSDAFGFDRRVSVTSFFDLKAQRGGQVRFAAAAGPDE